MVAYLPLAWDRYLLPLVPTTALLAAGAAVAVVESLTGRLLHSRPEPVPVAIPEAVAASAHR